MKKSVFRRAGFFSIFLAVLFLCTPVKAADSDARLWRLSQPNGMLSDGDKLYVLDGGSNVIYTLSDGVMQPFIGKSGVDDIYGYAEDGYHDASYEGSYFAQPYAMAPYVGGYAISDTANNVIRFAKDGKIYTAAGVAEAGYENARGIKARFDHPKGLAADGDGNLYIADSFNNVIRKMDTSGNVTTYAGSAKGYKDGTVRQAAFCEPAGICWYGGALYVADSGNHCIRKIKDGAVTTVAGGANLFYEDSDVREGGYADGAAADALFDNPEGVLVRDGVIYVADTGNSAFRKIKNGKVTTIDSLTDEKSLYPAQPVALAFHNGSLYGTDRFSGVVYTLAAESWQTGAEKKLCALMPKLGGKVTKQTASLDISITPKQTLVQSRGRQPVPMRIKRAGTVEIVFYTKTKRQSFAISTDKGKKKVLTQASMSEAEYDAGMGAYRTKLRFFVKKQQTVYLSASKGKFLTDSRLYR